MRILGHIPHPAYQVTVFLRGEDHVVQFQARGFVQSYRLPAAIHEDWQDLARLFDATMMEEVRERFQAMGASLQSALERHPPAGDQDASSD